MDELQKLLSTRRDARVAVIGPVEVVAKYIGETEKNIAAAFDGAADGGAILLLDEADDPFGKRGEIAEHDGPVVLGVRSIRSIPDELRSGVVVVKAPRTPWWRRRRERQR
jgi:SpoVK/Ycf46/Vps4 family AAA+-type ATPase